MMRRGSEVGMSRAMIALGLWLSTSANASAATAPILSRAMVQDTNDLQRAVWACEAGAPILTSNKRMLGKPRFFLGNVDSGAGLRSELPLMLGAGKLSGLGQISADKGWTNIRFTCGLSPGLDQARNFTFEILSPVSGSSQPPASGSTANSNDRMTWHIEGTDPLTLAHGVPETDDRDFRAHCAARSGTITVSLTGTVSGLKKGDYVTVSISSGSKSGLYIGRGIFDDNLGTVIPVLTIGDDPLLAWMATRASLLINIGAETVQSVSLKGSAAAVRHFENGCGRDASNPVAS